MGVQTLDEIHEPQDRIIAALDHESWSEAELFLPEISALVGLSKINSVSLRIGLDQAIYRIRQLGQLTMVDYKFNDIAETMRRQTKQAASAGAAVITLHASAGEAGLKGAVKGVEEALKDPHSENVLFRPWLLGVTVLTSMDEMECNSVFNNYRRHAVRKFTHIAADSGLDGVVCSASEAEALNNDPVTEHLLTIVPAIRPEYAGRRKDEQVMIATPKEAIRSGADMLVIGRPLLHADQYGLSIQEAVEIIINDIKAA